jgi:hypothetical protein
MVDVISHANNLKGWKLFSDAGAVAEAQTCFPNELNRKRR